MRQVVKFAIACTVATGVFIFFLLAMAVVKPELVFWQLPVYGRATLSYDVNGQDADFRREIDRFAIDHAFRRDQSWFGSSESLRNLRYTNDAGLMLHISSPAVDADYIVVWTSISSQANLPESVDEFRLALARFTLKGLAFPPP